MDNFILYLFFISDNFEFSRTKPKTRNIRDVSKSILDNAKENPGHMTGLEYSALLGATMFVILCLAIVIFIYRNKNNLKRENKISTHPL